MKTTQQKAVVAFTTITSMGQKPMNSLTAYKFFKLKKALKDAVDFQAEEEMKIINELGGSVTETGEIKLEDDKRAEFIARHKEMEEMECEINSDRVEIMLSEIKDISLADMEILEPFVEWKE